MRTIKKGTEPPSLTAWKKRNPRKSYEDLPDEIRRDIRQFALEEQFYLCAYCCQQIETIDVCHNEHLEAQTLNRRRLNRRRTLDFTNIVASCYTSNQCGKAHKSQILPLTPLMEKCETELQFKISGRVEGLSDRAITTIQVLNLGDDERNNRALIEKRKQFSYALLLKNGFNPDEGLEDTELLKLLLELLLDDLAHPAEGKLEPFAPVVISLLRGWLQPPKANSSS